MHLLINKSSDHDVRLVTNRSWRSWSSQCCVVVIIRVSYNSSFLDEMNSPLRVTTIGAAQRFLDYLLLVCGLQLYRRKQQCHGLFDGCFKLLSRFSYCLALEYYLSMAEVATYSKPQQIGTQENQALPFEKSNDPQELLERGCMQHGCAHYRRRCRIIAPCCNKIFDCRHCHNEIKNSIYVDQKERHEIPRHEVNQVICSLCGTEQEVGQECVNCGVCFGKYFCEICKLFDDDTSKKQYHCNGCGICRIGGRDNFFHCHKCGCCYSGLLKNSHPCVEGAMHHDCPVCFEYLFDSTNDVSVMPCGHTIHQNCLKEMRDHFQFGSFATTAGRRRRYSIMSWLKSA